jgi:4-aminobutyrate aminotransferase/(S)-3-amino-2-methylpropionate transaminase
VACEAALGVLDTIEEQGLLARSIAIGDKVEARLLAMRSSVPFIGDIRGLGGMVAIELTHPETRAPATAQTKAVVAEALKEGLILLSCGQDGNVLRLLVPLTATDPVLDQGLDILERALRSVA